MTLLMQRAKLLPVSSAACERRLCRS